MVSILTNIVRRRELSHALLSLDITNCQIVTVTVVKSGDYVHTRLKC